MKWTGGKFGIDLGIEFVKKKNMIDRHVQATGNENAMQFCCNLMKLWI